VLFATAGAGVGEAVGVGEGVTDGVGEVIGETVGVGVGLLTNLPLSQINFLPDFMQVNFLPAIVEVEPAFAQVAPGLTAENAGVESKQEKIKREISQETLLFMWPE
jgi:hypothetical protein